MSVAVKAWISVLLAVLVGFTVLTLLRVSQRMQTAQMPVTVTADKPLVAGEQPLDLASFKMTRRNGQKFSFAEFEGQVWVASLFFSTCPHECMKLNQSLAALQRDEAFQNVRFVSISVDPVTDTPATLEEYAKLFQADADRWLFLNGDISDVMRFGKSVGVTTGFKTHTRRLVLLDKTGKVRGHFSYNDGAAIKQMSELAPQLVAEELVERSPPQEKT